MQNKSRTMQNFIKPFKIELEQLMSPVALLERIQKIQHSFNDPNMSWERYKTTFSWLFNQSLDKHQREYVEFMWMLKDRQHSKKQ